MASKKSSRSADEQRRWRSVAALRILMEELFPDGGAVSVKTLAKQLEPLLDHLAEVPD